VIAVFLTDVAGVYTQNPKTHPDAATLISRIIVKENGEVSEQLHVLNLRLPLHILN